MSLQTCYRALLFIAASTLISGCGRTDSGPDTEWRVDPGTVLRRGNGGDPQSLDPSLADDVHAANVLIDLYEGLVVEAADGSLQPGVAGGWSISADGKAYTFSLRNDARWSTGQAVTAHHFVASFRRTLSANFPAPFAGLLSPLQNYSEVMNGELPVEELGVTAPEPGTLIIRLSAPAHHFLSVLAMPIAFPLFDNESVDPRRFRDPRLFVGNGPYVLADWQPGGRILLKRNENFRDADGVAIPLVEYLPIENLTTELNMYRAGELDITASVPAGMVGQLSSERPDELLIAPSLALYYLAFDLSEAPFDNAKLRQALSMSIDRQQLTNFLGRGERGAFGLVPPGVANHDIAEFSWRALTVSERESAARRLYEESGLAQQRPLEITLTYDVGDIHEKVALAISGMWRDVLGVNVTLDKREWKYFLSTRDNRAEWQIMRFAWFGDYNDASTFTDIFRSDSPQNLPGYTNANYDELLDQAAASMDPSARRTLMHEAEQLFIDDHAIAPIYFMVSKHMVSPRIRGFESNVLDRHPSRFLSFGPSR